MGGPDLQGASPKAQMMAQKVGPLASGPARMAVLAGRSRSCLRDRSTHSGNLWTSKENEGKAVGCNPGSSRTHKLERQACQRASLGGSGNWLFVGHRSRMETWHKTRSCSLPRILFSTGLELRSHPLTCSPAFSLTPQPLHLNRKQEVPPTLPPGSSEARTARAPPCHSATLTSVKGEGAVGDEFARLQAVHQRSHPARAAEKGMAPRAQRA